jgi:uncharacterized protein
MTAIRWLFAVAVLAACAAAHAGLKEGAIAYSRGDFATALRELKPLAEQGQPLAQYLVGVSQVNAKPPLGNVGEGEDWLKKAAGQGQIAAMRYLGELNLFAKKDRAEARRWLLQAADRGDAEAQHLMAIYLLDGPEADASRGEAYMWLHLAAERGHVLSGVMLTTVRPPFSPEQRADGLRRAGEWKPVR